MKERISLILFFCMFLQGYVVSLWAFNIRRPVVEKITFYTEDSIPLSGLLCLPPNSFPQKIVVYIPPLNEYDNVIVPMINHEDTITFLGKMLSHLIDSNIGFFTFSMRYPCNTGNFLDDLEIMKTKLYRSQTLNTLAEDAVNACLFLKKEERFEQVPIGVMGTSAMGRAAVMAAANCPSVSYAMLFATPSTDNFDDAEWQYERGSLNYVHLKEYFSILWDMVADSTFIYRNVRYSDRNSLMIKTKFIDCAWDCFKRINRFIIAKNENYDTIQYKATSLMKESFSRSNQNEIGDDVEANKFNDFVDTIMWYWYKPMDISFLKWNAEEWYSKLNIPTFIVFAEKDKIIDSFGSYRDLCAIKELYKKGDFGINMIKDADHSFGSTREGDITNSVLCKSISWLDKINK